MNNTKIAESVTSAIKRKSVFDGNWNKPIVLKQKIATLMSGRGSAYLFSDERYVGKLLFYREQEELEKFATEYEISKMMGDLGVGPKVYAFVELDFGFGRLPKEVSRFPAGTYGMLIIMENLAYGAKKLETLHDYVERTNTYPEKQVVSLYNKLRQAQVLHGDLHSNNILVKTNASNNIRLYFKSYKHSLRHMSNSNINNMFRNVNLNNMNGYKNTNNGNMIGLNKYVLNRNYKRLTGKNNSIFN